MSVSPEQLKMAEDLESAARFLRANPLPILPHVSDIYLFPHTKEEHAACVRAIGSCEKQFNNKWLYAIKPFNSFVLRVASERENVCERVKIGEKVIPARPETVLPATEEKVEAVYEWRCPDSFLALAKTTEEVSV